MILHFYSIFYQHLYILLTACEVVSLHFFVINTFVVKCSYYVFYLYWRIRRSPGNLPTQLSLTRTLHHEPMFAVNMSIEVFVGLVCEKVVSLFRVKHVNLQQNVTSMKKSICRQRIFYCHANITANW